MRCKDCKYLCYNKRYRLNFCFARYAPIGDDFLKERACDEYREGNWENDGFDHLLPPRTGDVYDDQ